MKNGSRGLAQRRSAGVTIVAAIMLAYSLLCLFIYHKEVGGVINPIIWIVAMIMGIPILDAVVYLIAASFIFRLKKWARVLAVVYSSIAFLLRIPMAIKGIGHLYIFWPGNFFVLHPKVFGVTSYTPESFFSVSLAVGIYYIPMVLYALFIYFLTRPKIKAQFR